ncbi:MULTISPECIES: GntR family transcriptional regulator [unclassified Caballeronia]|uniref:GntR family transcriptional regulator n=1 Tax=unclassified Caballeronia TaxID=2646786 RepID=UPI002858B52E|nr:MULTISPECIES: GntR family transcriptional regulator [unclassified Caballeronia]MDR5845203.1 GntR family transcriptional regulator [Caballeronia sp. LZ031]
MPKLAAERRDMDRCSKTRVTLLTESLGSVTTPWRDEACMQTTMIEAREVDGSMRPSTSSRSAVSMATVRGQQPRYMQLAQTLVNEIEDGRYPVGSTIPTEFELCEQFGASRSTVREAVKQLAQLGMVVRQPGVGTTVKALKSVGAHTQVMQQLSDLQRYTANTVLEILSKDTEPLVDDAVCALLRANPGETWLHVRSLRRSPDSVDAICHTDAYIHPAFRSLEVDMNELHTPLFTIIEREFGEQIAQVQQEIRAIALPPAIGQLLNAKARSPALWVCRRYLNRRGDMVEGSINIHPADRYTYSETFQRSWNPA